MPIDGKFDPHWDGEPDSPESARLKELRFLRWRQVVLTAQIAEILFHPDFSNPGYVADSREGRVSQLDPRHDFDEEISSDDLFFNEHVGLRHHLLSIHSTDQGIVIESEQKYFTSSSVDIFAKISVDAESVTQSYLRNYEINLAHTPPLVRYTQRKQWKNEVGTSFPTENIDQTFVLGSVEADRVLSFVYLFLRQEVRRKLAILSDQEQWATQQKKPFFFDREKRRGILQLLVSELSEPGTTRFFQPISPVEQVFNVNPLVYPKPWVTAETFSTGLYILLRDQNILPNGNMRASFFEIELPLFMSKIIGPEEIPPAERKSPEEDVFLQTYDQVKKQSSRLLDEVCFFYTPESWNRLILQRIQELKKSLLHNQDPLHQFGRFYDLEFSPQTHRYTFTFACVTDPEIDDQEQGSVHIIQGAQPLNPTFQELQILYNLLPVVPGNIA